MKGLLVVFVLLLTGCASHSSQFGTYSEAPAGHREIMAIDAANQLASIYPPASTRFVLEIEPADPFGQALVARLRLTGYSIQEAPAANASRQALRLGYVLDNLDENTYRLLITTGSTSLSRAYLTIGNKFTPGGLWARREG